jgi:hypothetical protein
VIGHWLMAAPYVERSELSLGDMLHTAPWTQWLTWAFQVMPLFFIVGGYANATSWESARRAGTDYATWVHGRLRRLLGPIVPLLLLWAGLAIVAEQVGVKPTTIKVGSQVALIPTWFLAVYVMVVVAAPATHRLWTRLGVASFVLLATGAVAVDAVAFGMDTPGLRWANYAFVWLGVHQLGYMWRHGYLQGVRRSLAWAAAGLTGLLILVFVVGFPVSMISVPGEEVSNSRPPTVALLFLGMFHGGLALALEAPARRWLANSHPWAMTIVVNARIMTLYLWHATALVLVVGAANALAGFGMHYEPGTATWWLSRPLWIAVLALVLLPFVVTFARFETLARGAAAAAPAAWRAVVGSAAICWGIAALALGGIGGDGPLGIRAGTIGVVLVGVMLATVTRPVGRAESRQA